MGKNKGFHNERMFIESINNKFIKEMPRKSSVFIKEAFEKVPKIEEILFNCKKNEGIGIEKKNDVTVTANKFEINISLKSGKNNSVHQENIYSFLDYLENNFLDFNDEIKDLILKFHWCDDTLDNSGMIKDRIRRDIFVKKYPIEYEKYCNFFFNIKDFLFERVMLGTINKPEYLLYIDDTSNYFFSNMKDIYKKHLDSIKPWGLFSFQNCNACLNGSDCGHDTHVCDSSCPKIQRKTKKHRQDIQFKWSNIEKYVKN